MRSCCHPPGRKRSAWSPSRPWPGVPPIAAGHGSFTELITPGVDGVLFSPGDPAALALAIADVERNPEQYEAYGEQARKTYEQRFDPERSVEELLEIYRFAIAHPV